MSLGETDDPLDVEAAIDGLFRLEIAAFTDMRNALSKRLTAAGNRVAAERIRALRKPNVSAWAVNQLWWNARGQFEAMLDAARRLRDAQSQGAGPIEQQRLTGERRRTIDALLAEARSMLETHGRAPSTGVIRKVMTTLEACAARPDALPVPGPGRLSDDLDPPGFEALAGLLRAPLLEASPPSPPPRPPAALLAARDRAAAASRAADEARVAAENALGVLQAREADAQQATAAVRIAMHAAEVAEQAVRAAKAEAEQFTAALTQRLEALRHAEAEVARLRSSEQSD